jgi:hypothetical protein
MLTEDTQTIGPGWGSFLVVSCLGPIATQAISATKTQFNLCHFGFMGVGMYVMINILHNLALF